MACGFFFPARHFGGGKASGRSAFSPSCRAVNNNQLYAATIIRGTSATDRGCRTCASPTPSNVLVSREFTTISQRRNVMSHDVFQRQMRVGDDQIRRLAVEQLGAGARPIRQRRNHHQAQIAVVAGRAPTQRRQRLDAKRVHLAGWGKW